MSSATQVKNGTGEGAQTESNNGGKEQETEMVQVETAKQPVETGGDGTPKETAEPNVYADGTRTPTKKKEPEEVEEAQAKLSTSA